MREPYEVATMLTFIEVVMKEYELRQSILSNLTGLQSAALVWATKCRDTMGSEEVKRFLNPARDVFGDGFKLPRLSKSGVNLTMMGTHACCLMHKITDPHDYSIKFGWWSELRVVLMVTTCCVHEADYDSVETYQRRCWIVNMAEAAERCSCPCLYTDPYLDMSADDDTYLHNLWYDVRHTHNMTLRYLNRSLVWNDTESVCDYLLMPWEGELCMFSYSLTGEPGRMVVNYPTVKQSRLLELPDRVELTLPLEYRPAEARAPGIAQFPLHPYMSVIISVDGNVHPTFSTRVSTYVNSVDVKEMTAPMHATACVSGPWASWLS